MHQELAPKGGELLVFRANVVWPSAIAYQMASCCCNGSLWPLVPLVQTAAAAAPWHQWHKAGGIGGLYMTEQQKGDSPNGGQLGYR
jgi:hypothetical protein